MYNLNRRFIFFILIIFPIYSNSASHHPQEFLQSISGSSNEGEQIVQHYCSNCHGVKPIIKLNAPRVGIKDDWSFRLKQGFDVLFKHTDEGINAMPARGGCFECSDKQLKLAIKAMLPKMAVNSVLKSHADQ